MTGEPPSRDSPVELDELDTPATPATSARATAIGERRALAAAASAALAVVVWITLPIGIGILLGALAAFVMRPVYERIRVHSNTVVAGLATVAGSFVAIASLVAGAIDLFAVRGADLATRIGAAAFEQRGAAMSWASRIAQRLGVSPEDAATRLRDAAASLLAHAAAWARGLLTAMTGALLALFFALLTMYFMLRRWQALMDRAEIVSPLRRDHTRALFDEFRTVGRATLLGTVITGLAQGVLAGLGYWIAGVPEPVFFAAATAVASLIPAIGTLLVWVPIGLTLAMFGHLVGGLFTLVWGLVAVVGVSDYWLRPRLVRGGGEVPTVLTFASLFGGVELLGLKGLIVGPVLMSIALAVLRLYAREAAARRVGSDRAS